ncbi:MAG: zf-HC2 domain-containing protein [Chloroflexota bacterium]
MEQHILPPVSDYVLDLLPENDRHMLETHAATCSDCRRALEQERQIETLVRQTLQVATQPNSMRLQALRPRVVERQAQQPTMFVRQLAPVMLLLFILAGTLVLQVTRVAGEFNIPAPAFYKNSTPTATNTSTPTATIANLDRQSHLSQDAVSMAFPVQPPAPPTETAAPRPASQMTEPVSVSTPEATAPSADTH